MKDKTRIEVLKHQEDFIFSDKVHTGLVGGFRSGKSHSGVLKTIKKKLQYPNFDVAYYLPTYGLIKDVAYPKFTEYLEVMNVPYRLNKSDHEYLTPYGRIILRSMDNPDTIIGYEVAYSCADEMDVLSISHANEAFVKMVSRLSVRLPDGKKNSLDFVSTPEGFKFLYDFFIKNPNEEKLLIKASTENNPFISESYIDTLRMSYSPQQLDAYLNGEFVNLTSGTVYHHFDRMSNHSDRALQANDVIHAGMDFNIGNMSAVINVIDGDKKTAVAEITKAYDTPDIIRILKERFPGHSIVVYPDASGKNRNSSGKSDIDMLKQEGFIVRVPSQNPFVKDRVNAVNNGFRAGDGSSTLYVNTHNCPSLTEALARQSYRNGEPDKTTGFDNVTDAYGYFVYGTKINKTAVRSSGVSNARDRYYK